jgi:hypothetical protein
VGSDQAAQGGGKVASVLDNMDVLSGGSQFVRTDRGQTAADYYGLRVVFLGQLREASAFCGRSVSDATGVDDDQLRLPGRIDLAKALRFEKLANLLAFVLVDLAAEG